MRIKIFLLLFSVSIFCSAQSYSFIEKELSINENLDGTLLYPKNVENAHLAILIAGSGPTDRDGNQNFLKSNSLKKLAEALSSKGIATFRYDKRIVKQLQNGNYDENISFDYFVEDAIAVLEYFRKASAYNKIFIIGHSQGSLVGMLASIKGADGFISIAGAGQTIDEVITDQVLTNAPMFEEDCDRIFKILRQGETTSDFPVALSSIFRLDVQPFLSSWMKYDPAKIISELNIPILIINGTKDIQVSQEEAKLLAESNPKAKLAIIDKMNHVLVTIEGDNLENTKSYNEPERKLAEGLSEEIIKFLNQ